MNVFVDVNVPFKKGRLKSELSASLYTASHGFHLESGKSLARQSPSAKKGCNTSAVSKTCQSLFSRTLATTR